MTNLMTQNNNDHGMMTNPQFSGLMDPNFLAGGGMSFDHGAMAAAAAAAAAGMLGPGSSATFAGAPITSNVGGGPITEAARKEAAAAARAARQAKRREEKLKKKELQRKTKVGTGAGNTTIAAATGAPKVSWDLPPMPMDSNMPTAAPEISNAVQPPRVTMAPPTGAHAPIAVAAVVPLSGVPLQGGLMAQPSAELPPSGAGGVKADKSELRAVRARFVFYFARALFTYYTLIRVIQLVFHQLIFY